MTDKQLRTIAPAAAIVAIFAMLIFAARQYAGTIAIVSLSIVGAVVIIATITIGTVAYFRLRLLHGRYADETDELNFKRQERKLKIDLWTALTESTIRQAESGYLHPVNLLDASLTPRKNVKEFLPPLALPEPYQNNLLDSLERVDRILVVGGMGAGKTTLLMHLVEQRNQRSKVVVIDTHSAPNKWLVPGNRVIGAARDYSQVESFLEYLSEEMNNRYQDIAAGKVAERGHEILTIIADEWTLLPQKLPHLKPHIDSILTEGRKAGIDMILCAHDSTVESLGIKGKAGLKKAFSAFCYPVLNGKTGERYIDVAWEHRGAKERYEHPGKFIVNGTTILPTPMLPANSESSPLVVEVEPEPEPESDAPSEDQMNILTAFKFVQSSDRFSWRKVCKKCTELGTPLNGNGRSIKRVKSTLDEFGIDYE